MADSVKVVAKNSKAYHDYFIEDKYEAGIELAGTEVKSIRLGHVNLKDSFCVVKDGEMSVIGMHISPYEKGNIFNKDPMRQRRLLMHKREILRLFARIKQDGYSLIPLSIYFRGPRVKLELGLARAKSSMTSVTPPQRGTPSGRWTGLSRAETDDPLRGDKKGYDPSEQSHHHH